MSLPAEVIRWRNAVFAAFVLCGFGLANWVARIPTVRDDLQVSTGDLGLLIFGLSVGSVLGLVAANIVMSRMPPGRGMAAAICTIALGMLTIGVGSTLFAQPVLIFAGLFLFGLGQGCCDVIMNVQGAMVERRIGKTLLPLLHASFSLGTMGGAGLGALASALAVPVIWHLGFVAVLMVAGIAWASRSVPAGELHTAPSAGWRKKAAGTLAVWRQPRILLIGLIMLGMSFAEGSANDWIALATVDGHGLSNAAGAVVFGVFVTAMTAGRVIGGPLLDRFGRVPVLRVSAILGLLGLAVFIFSPWPPAAIAATVLWGVGCSLGFPVGMSAAADDPEQAGARVSVVAMIGYFAFLAGPPLLGFVGEHTGILHALIIVLVLVAAAGLAAPAARERERFAR